MTDIASIAKIGKKAIPGDNPTGYECHSMPGYQFVRGEIDKLKDVRYVTDVDWEGLIKESVDILQYRSKDLLIACYLAYALLRQNDDYGLWVGTLLLYNLLYYFYDDLFPKNKQKAWVNALEWYFEQSHKYISNQDLSPDYKNVKKSIANLEAIKTILSNHEIEPDYYPSLHDNLKKLIEGGGDSFEAVETATEATQITSERKKVSLQGDETFASKEEGFAILVKAARTRLSIDTQDPYAYYLNRLASWGVISIMPVVEDGDTLVAPPEPFNKDLIEQEHEGPIAYIRLIEQMLPLEPFWFDLQITLLETLQNAGEGYSTCYDVVKQEFFHLLDRFPGIENLTFNDGMPFVSEANAVKLANLRATKLINAAQRTTDLSKEQQKQLQKIKKVIANLSKKDYAKELNQLDLIGKEAISDKVRLIGYMSICEELMQRNNPTILKPYLSFMLDLIKLHNLSSWDPCLSLEALVVVYRGLRAMKVDHDSAEFEYVFNQITRLDINIAMELAQS